MATITGSRPSTGGAALGVTQQQESHPYTCNTCQVAFRNSDLQRSHMRSDWHRYNLKRRVSTLPPISSEIFTEKVLQARAATTAEADKAGFERPCDICQRTYYSENSYQNHIGSAKHKAREAVLARRPDGTIDDEASSIMSSTFSLGDPLPVGPDVDPDAEVEFSHVVDGLKNADLQDRPSPVKRPSNPPPSAAEQRKEEHPLSQSPADKEMASSTGPTPSKNGSAAPARTLKSCIFCNYESPTVPLNATHMERIHGMFIPEKSYLVDMDGLLEALQQRVFDLNECLSCGKGKSNAYAVQTHMRDKGHCTIPYTTEAEQLEIGDYYDFRSTYSDDEGSDDESTEDRQNGGAKLGLKRPTKIVGEDGTEITGENDGWETDSSASSLDSDELTAVPLDQHYHQYERLDKHPHHSHKDPRAHHQRDGWHSHAHKHTHAVFHDDYELHLPSGKSVGHRSLNRYYRQNLHNYPTAEERQEQLLLKESEESMDIDASQGGQDVARRDHRDHRRALLSRTNAGITGITDQKKKEVVKVAQRGRDAQNVRNRRHEWGVNRGGNNQKFYYYREG